MLARFTALYPVWIVASSVLGLLHPPALVWFTGPWVVWALTVVMLSMGLTLTLDDTRSKPIPITGIALQETDSPAPAPELITATISERIEGAGETRLTRVFASEA